jgi:predicted transcriptional regulator
LLFLLSHTGERRKLKPKYDYHQFEQYQSFDSINDLNESVRQALYYNADQLNKTQVNLLKLLSRFSCVIPGVSWMKASTIAKHLEKSEKTVRRSLKTLEQLEIIKRIPTIRKQGGRGYDIVIINSVQWETEIVSSRYDTQNGCQSKDKEGVGLKETLTNKQLNKRNNTAYSAQHEIDYTFTSDKVPKAFTRLVRYFYNDASTIEEYWHMTLVAAYRGNREQDHKTVLETSIHSFKQMIGKLKRGAVNNPIAYYFSVLQNKFDELYFEELQELGVSCNNYQPSLL